MKGKISTGIWFIFFGTIALLHNFNVINFNFWAILRYWPLIIIAVGANLIFQNKPSGTLILSIINVAICIFLGYIGLTSTQRFNLGGNINFTNTDDTVGSSKQVQADYVTGTEKASLHLNIGAAAVVIDSIPSSKLLEASSSNNNVGLKLETQGDSINPELDLTTIIKSNNNNKNKVALALNQQPIWNMELNMGAASLTANFSQHKIEHLEINAGAASLNMSFGMPQVNESIIDINTAASSCELNIPKDAACRIEMESILTAKKFEGFNKKDDAQQTENYDSAEKKYIIKITGAANSLKINRY